MGVLPSFTADDYDPLDLEKAPPAGSAADVGEPAILKALGSGKLLVDVEGSLSFERARATSGSQQVETEIFIQTGDPAAPAPQPVEPLPQEIGPARLAGLPGSAAESHMHEAAALKLQKVYRGFRTRRQLADCAVLVEHSWRKLLDFALLKRTSVSFDIEKQETALSKWSRAIARAAKVGKGLHKGNKAQDLALQNSPEAPLKEDASVILGRPLESRMKIKDEGSWSRL